MSGSSFYENSSATAESSVNGAGREAVVVNAKTVRPESPGWLWPGRLIVGALANMVGLPDQGKSLVFCDLAARLTVGSPMPPERYKVGVNAPQRVMTLTTEDSLGTTIVPRLIKAGADLALLDFVQMVRDTQGQTSLLTLAFDLDVLGVALQQHHYALLIVDGIAGYLGDAKTHNDADVRRVLAPFAALLDREKVAGLGVMHPPKAVTNLAYFAGGSIAFTAVPRVTLGIGPDPNDESENPRRLLLKIKGNLYGAVPTLGYRIVADDPAGVPWIEWEPDPVSVNIADVLDPVKETPEDRSTRRACEQWLRAHLADGPQPAKDVAKAAADAGFTKTALRHAKDKVVEVVKRQFDGPWVWMLR